MERLEFTSDTNSLLTLGCFPTLRLENPSKYSRHKTFEVTLGKKAIGIVECVSISVIPFCGLTTNLAYLLYGHGLRYLQAILGRMYPGTNWQTQRLYFMMMKFKERYPEQAQHSEVKRTNKATQGKLPLGARVNRPI